MTAYCPAAISFYKLIMVFDDMTDQISYKCMTCDLVEIIVVGLFVMKLFEENNLLRIGEESSKVSF